MRWSWIWGGPDPMTGVLMGTGDNAETQREPRWAWRQRLEPRVCVSRNAEGRRPAPELDEAGTGARPPGASGSRASSQRFRTCAHSCERTVPGVSELLGLY